MKHEYFLRMARKESKKSNHHSYQLGAVIARGNRILGVGHNMIKTHPKSPHKFKNIHAEFMAVLNAGREDLVGATAYVFREQKNENWACSKPCKYCWQYLVDCGIKSVVYSFEGSFIQERVG